MIAFKYGSTQVFYFDGNLPFRGAIISRENGKFVILDYRKEIFTGVVTNFF